MSLQNVSHVVIKCHVCTQVKGVQKKDKLKQPPYSNDLGAIVFMDVGGPLILDGRVCNTSIALLIIVHI